MVRLIAFFIVAVALAWSAAWVVDHPGQMTLDWGGWRVDTSVGVLVFAVAAVAVLAALLYRLWLFLTRAPGRVTQALKERRSRKGYQALTKGMVAVAAGDAEEAAKQVGKADGLLREPPLTLLLKAQAAQLNGDEKAAETFFTAMLDDPEMAFLGLRGLLNQALKADDQAQALELARRAQDIKPKSAWLAETVFQLESRAGHWLKAEEALKPVKKLSGLGVDHVTRRRAVTLLGQSVEAETSGDRARALKLAEKAVNEAPLLTPAQTHLARLLVEAGNFRKAASQIEKAWADRTHPELAAIYLDASQADNGLARARAAEKLLAIRPQSADAHIVMGWTALDAKLWGEARDHLGQAIAQGHATRGVFALMARLEDEERKDKDAARTWLAKAANAPHDDAWVCAHCGQVEAHWAPHCPKCHEFDALDWGRPSGVDVMADVARLQG